MQRADLFIFLWCPDTVDDMRILSTSTFCGCKENGPKTVKLFKNQPGTLDFDSADSMEPIQIIE